MTMLDTTIVNIALPDIQHRLDASLTQALWVVNSYTLVFAALLLTFGRLGDRTPHVDHSAYTDAMPAAIWTVVGVLAVTAIATTRTHQPQPPMPSDGT